MGNWLEWTVVIYSIYQVPGQSVQRTWFAHTNAGLTCHCSYLPEGNIECYCNTTEWHHHYKSEEWQQFDGFSVQMLAQRRMASHLEPQHIKRFCKYEDRPDIFALCLGYMKVSILPQRLRNYRLFKLGVAANTCGKLIVLKLPVMIHEFRHLKACSFRQRRLNSTKNSKR